MTSTPSSESLTASRPNVTVSRTVSEMFSVKEWRDLETGVGVFQGSLKKIIYDFFLVGHCNSIFHHFRGKARYWSKYVGMLPSRLLWKSRMVGLPDDEKTQDICNCLDRVPACDRQTDRQTDILPRHSARYGYASRGKNLQVSI